MNLGGPVWHASVGGEFAPGVRRRLAIAALAGVGDAALGEWHDDRARAYHVRRRLSAAEAARFVPGGVRDLRGTAEAVSRLEAAIANGLPQAAAEFAAAEIAG